MTATDFDALETPLVRKRVRVGKRDASGTKERTIQRAIVKALRAMGLRVHHSPNGAAYRGGQLQRMRQGKALKDDGMIAGFPDLIVWRPISRGGPDFALIEAKRPGGYLEPEQLDFQAQCWRDGVKYAVVTSLDEALAALAKWGWL